MPTPSQAGPAPDPQDRAKTFARADAHEIHRLLGRATLAEQALKRIRALDLGKTPTGRDDFYTGPDRFFQAWLIANHALKALND